eukprot:SAG31_NODE_4625_length_3087_cov_8.343039_3_plen_129_part_00
MFAKLAHNPAAFRRLNGTPRTNFRGRSSPLPFLTTLGARESTSLGWLCLRKPRQRGWRWWWRQQGRCEQQQLAMISLAAARVVASAALRSVCSINARLLQLLLIPSAVRVVAAHACATPAVLFQKSFV